MGEYANRFMSQLVAKNPGEPEFHQAVHELADSVELALQRNPRYVEAKIFERICEPERVVMFRVPWVDDDGDVQINRGFRVEINSAIGPYKGGTALPPDRLPRHAEVPGGRTDVQERAHRRCRWAAARAAPTSTQGQARRAR